MNEYLLIDKVGDYHYFNQIKDIATYLDLEYNQVVWIYNQSIKHYNRIHPVRNVYIQRLFNDPTRTPKLIFKTNKYIYYVNDDGTIQDGVNFPIF